MTTVRLLACSILCAPVLADDPQPPAPHDPPAAGAGQIELEAPRADLDAPIGVLGDRPQYEGAWQFSFRSLRTDHQGMLRGRSEVSEQDVFDEGYSRAPTKLVREEYIFSALYGYSEDLSILITLPWISNDMRFMTSGGQTVSQRAIGLGDMELTGLYSLVSEEDEHVHLNLGISLPTGSHDERDVLPSSGGKTVKLPYPMQLGSGTTDLIPGITWFHLDDATSWGAQISQTLRFEENSDDWGMGNETLFTGWVARQFQDDLSASLRMSYQLLGRYDGQDPELDPTLDPSQDPRAQGGERMSLFLGLNYTRPGGHRFAFEMGGPLFQDLNGPQLETDVVYALGWQFSF